MTKEKLDNYGLKNPAIVWILIILILISCGLGYLIYAQVRMSQTISDLQDKVSSISNSQTDPNDIYQIKSSLDDLSNKLDEVGNNVLDLQ
jgi:hypothetical protein